MHITNPTPLNLDLIAAGPTYDIDRLVSAFKRLDNSMGIDFSSICEQIDEDYECDVDYDQMWADIFDETDLRVRASRLASLAVRPHLLEATEGESRCLRSSARILMTGLQVPAKELTQLSQVCPDVTLSLRWEPMDSANHPSPPNPAELSGWRVFAASIRN